MEPEIGLLTEEVLGNLFLTHYATEYNLCVFVPLRVLGLPIPQVPTHDLQILRRCETELLLRQSGVCREIRDIATTDNLLLC
jgi:hypothetical protein